MKSSTIVRIVLWSLVAVILTGILAWGIGFKSGFGWPWHFGGDGSGYTSGEASFDASEIDEVQVEWVSGKLIIEEGTQISFREEASHSLDEDEQVSYRVDGRKLIIREYRRSVWFGSTPSKDLYLTLPQELRKLDLEVVSADVTMTGKFTLDELDMEGVSGRWQVSEVSCRTVDIESVSGNFEVTIGEMPDKIDMDTVSGDLVLYLPENEGFTAEVDGVSGDLSSEFATVSEKKRQIYGNGRTEIDGDTVSGDIEIRKRR